MKSRRQRVDSTASAVRITQQASQPIVPPLTVPLDKGDLPFFVNVIEEFGRSEWSAHQLEIAALLALSMADLSREQRLLREEGAVVDGAMGSPVVNPRKQVVQMHQNAIVSFRRTLGVHARAVGGGKEEIAKRIAITKRIEADALDSDDDLIARPN